MNFAVPAIANAIAVALRHPVTRLPVQPAQVIAILEQA